MTLRIPENVSGDWSFVTTIMDGMQPPRDPNNDDDDDEGEEDGDEEDEEKEPAVIREPDE